MKKFPEYVAAFKRLNYQFRLNSMNDTIECNGQQLTDAFAATVESKMFDLDFTSAAGIRRNLTRIAYENQYHPLQEWLTEQGKSWDGVDYFAQWMGYIDFKYPVISQQFFWRFLLGAVGKVLHCDQNFMLVLDGRQGLGKSYLSRWLLPDKLRGYFVEGGLEPDHKDTKLRIISNFLWEVGELQGVTKRADLESLKNVITQERVTARPAYGRYDIDKPITCSFIGTVNENGAGFLNDITGNRRFAVVNIENIRWEYADINPCSLWGQVVASYWAGERGNLNLQEQQEQQVINSEYATLSHTEQYFFALFDVDLMNAADDWMPITEIMEQMELQGLKGNQRMQMMELASILQDLGCQKSRSGAETGRGRATCYNGVVQKRKPVSMPNPFNP